VAQSEHPQVGEGKRGRIFERRVFNDQYPQVSQRKERGVRGCFGRDDAQSREVHEILEAREVARTRDDEVRDFGRVGAWSEFSDRDEIADRPDDVLADGRHGAASVAARAAAKLS